MLEDAHKLRDEALSRIEAAGDLAALDDVRVAVLGKKGALTGLMKGLGKLQGDDRKTAGQTLNEIKDAIAGALDTRHETLKAAALEAKLASETIDMTLPVRHEAVGSVHPISQTIEECIAIFAEMGFEVGEGPDIENDWLNFGALNIPPEHPARQMHDTFYMPPADDGTERVLRTHTSPVQIRSMTSLKPPIRVIAPGRTYRSDYDLTHTPMFHQVEGIVIDDGTHMGHLKGCLEDFCRAFFDVADLPLRFRPSFFPFTEPSAEVDIGCKRNKHNLELGNYGDWLEILGCGMVHPRVIANCGLDPDRYQGFAFGMGVERIAMLKYGIPDLRTFFEADLRWLKHYGFAALAQPNTAFGLTGHAL